MDAKQTAERIAKKRWTKPAWALDWEAEAFDSFRADLLASIQYAGQEATETAKPRLRELYRVVRAGRYQEALVACYEAAILITWDMRRRGHDQNYICTLSVFADESGDTADSHFEIGYLAVRKAFY